MSPCVRRIYTACVSELGKTIVARTEAIGKWCKWCKVSKQWILMITSAYQKIFRVFCFGIFLPLDLFSHNYGLWWVGWNHMIGRDWILPLIREYDLTRTSTEAFLFSRLFEIGYIWFVLIVFVFEMQFAIVDSVFAYLSSVGRQWDTRVNCPLRGRCLSFQVSMVMYFRTRCLRYTYYPRSEYLFC